jgi:hypothetical protein
VVDATDTYLTGSDLDISGHLKVGSILRWKLIASKTGGTGVATWNIRFGDGATLTDVARITVTGPPVQSVATDVADFDVIAVIRQTGATCIAAGAVALHHTNGTAGFKNDEGNHVMQATSTAFDVTPANTKAGISVNSATGATWTFQVIAAELVNAV